MSFGFILAGARIRGPACAEGKEQRVQDRKCLWGADLGRQMERPQETGSTGMSVSRRPDTPSVIEVM